MADLGLVLLVIMAILPFALALKLRMPGHLAEPPFRAKDLAIIVFPACFHCGLRHELDVTSYLDEAAVMRAPTVMKSPPCRSCGQRWRINLTKLVHCRRAGAL